MSQVSRHTPCIIGHGESEADFKIRIKSPFPKRLVACVQQMWQCSTADEFNEDGSRVSLRTSRRRSTTPTHTKPYFDEYTPFRGE